MLKVGFSRVDVTPPLGTPVAGYFRERISDGVLDPIEIVALAANDGENTVLVMTLDFMAIYEQPTTEIRNLISQETGVPAEHIYIQSIHQHTSAQLGANPHLYDVETFNTKTSDVYDAILYRKFVDVAKMAIDDLSEAQMSVAEAEVEEQLSFVRRFKMKDGSVVTNPKREQIPDVVAPIGEPDNTVRLVRFTRKDAKDIALVNFSTHPDVVAGNKFSADWPGFVRRMTEKDLSDVQCILVNGAQGDTNHINRFIPKTTLSNYEFSARMGRIITDTVLKIWDQTESKKADKVSGQVQMKYIPTNTSRIDEVEECQRLKAEHMAGAKNLHGMAAMADAYRAAALYSQSLFQKVPLSVIQIGTVALVGFGGEPFTQYATDARAAAPDLYVLASCCTNGYAGYLPTKEAFEEGGYEAKTTNFTIGLVDVVNETVKEMLDHCQR